MKIVIALLTMCILAVACSTPKKTAPRRNPNAATRAEILKGGTSFTNPVVIPQQSEREVLDEEYKWFSNNYPGYSLIKRAHIVKSPKHYDVVRIKTREGRMRDIYFDCTQFWGKK